VARHALFCFILLIAYRADAQRVIHIYEQQQRVDTWTVPDSAALIAKANEWVRSKWKSGYLFASIDSVTTDAIYLYRGSIVQSPSWMRAYHLAERELREAVNGGHPFARISWNAPMQNEDAPVFTYRMEKGPQLFFDSLVLLSEIKTKPTYIMRMLDLQKGTPYSEHSFQSISDRIQRISFLSLNSPPDVSFQSSSVWTYLDLAENAQGSFEGVLGVLPSQGSNSGVLFTGNLDLKLINLFRSGKQLDFKWAQFAEQSQRLDVGYYHPFIAGTSFHLASQFKLFKQDTSFLNRDISLAGSFFIASRLEMSVGYEQANATILTTNIDQIITRNWLDFQQDWYSIGVKRKDDNRTKAKTFFNHSVAVALGARRVNRNVLLPQELYDTVRMTATNMRLSAWMETQRKLSENTFLYFEVNAAHLANKQDFSNQLYRVGGLQTLRGFNEQFFFTSSYLISQLEWRLFFEEESYVFAFYDLGFLHTARWQLPGGVGGGFSLLTNSGLFSFALAVGKSQDIPFELANMKIHFGYLSRF